MCEGLVDTKLHGGHQALMSEYEPFWYKLWIKPIKNWKAVDI